MTSTTPTKLGAAIAKGAAPPAPKSRLVAALEAANPPKPIIIPDLGITAQLTLIGTGRALDIEGDVSRAMKARELALVPMTQGMWELERARHVLAAAVLDDDGNPLGTLADWAALPKELIASVWAMYADLAEERDPREATLSDEERAAIEAAVKDRNASMLRALGIHRVAAWLCSPPTPTQDTAES